LVESSGVPEACISCTTAFPREVTRREMCTGLSISGIPCIGGSRVTGPSHSPARLLTVLKDVWESVTAAGGVVD